MGFLEIFTLVTSSATIFALIMGVFSFYNGRYTRREISNLIKQTHQDTQNLIRESRQDTQNLTKDIIKETQNLIVRESEENRKILQNVTNILDKIHDKVG
ncbi:MAG: hypothetical protein SCARUB_04589 [Candidatus Scalindua rubra]|uniref:Uncharacterized protein n=1 Tax=Candidatus Scalindua rubra TaxID=1872076 RepID=A0A1E3X413_9BACT|nr:MAG: hypothetical protein SCARUB_04589 [Candidatus Scalindua rubra]